MLYGKKNGQGILFYQNGNKYYEGNFENDEIFGKGIKYYDNGSIKFEGIFDSLNSIDGKYFSPDNELIYKGIIKNEIPLNIQNIKIYNDYTYQIYEGDIKNDKYEACFLKYNPSYYLEKNILQSNEEEEIIRSKILFLSYETYTGKTALIERIIKNTFREEVNFPTIGLDFKSYHYKYLNHNYKSLYYDTNSHELSRHMSKSYLNYSDIIIFTFNLFSNTKFDEEYIIEIFNIFRNKPYIYLVGNKMSNYQNRDLDPHYFREEAMKLINEKKIYKYFEVNVKSGEGIENLINNIKFDNAKICKEYKVEERIFKEKKECGNLNNLNKRKKKYGNLNNLNKLNKLNKWINI